MRHNIRAEAFGLRFRPVEYADAAFIVWLRNSQHALGRIGDSAADLAAQEQWLRSYFDRPGDYYFIVETKGGVPVGTYGVYDLSDNTAEAGRWILRPGPPAAAACLLLALDLAFLTLKLSAVRTRTVSTNTVMLSIYRKLGFQQVGLARNGQVINGRPVDLVLSRLTAEAGCQARLRMLEAARWAEPKLLEWEKIQTPQPGGEGRIGTNPWFIAADPAA